MIEKLENVTAIAKANIYFDGKVISHTVLAADGDRKTLGIFLPGDYEFGTSDAEIKDITRVRLRLMCCGIILISMAIVFLRQKRAAKSAACCFRQLRA